MGMDVYGLDPKKDAENITEIIELEFKLEELVKKRKYVEGKDIKGMVENTDNEREIESFEFEGKAYVYDKKLEGKIFKIEKELEKLASGRYFRANIWSWRPLCAVMSLAVSEDEYLKKMFTPDVWSGFNHNDGCGVRLLDKELDEPHKGTIYVKDPDDFCNKLADSIEKLIKEDVVISNLNSIQINLGSYCTLEGKHVTQKELINYSKGIEKAGMLLIEPIYPNKGNDHLEPLHSSHSIEISHIKEFIRFLKNCGGFEIW